MSVGKERDADKSPKFAEPDRRRLVVVIFASASVLLSNTGYTTYDQ